MRMTSLQCVSSVLCHKDIIKGDVALPSGEYIKEKFRQSFRVKAMAVNLNMQLPHSGSNFTLVGRIYCSKMNKLGF